MSVLEMKLNVFNKTLFINIYIYIYIYIWKKILDSNPTICEEKLTTNNPII